MRSKQWVGAVVNAPATSRPNSSKVPPFAIKQCGLRPTHSTRSMRTILLMWRLGPKLSDGRNVNRSVTRPLVRRVRPDAPKHIQLTPTAPQCGDDTLARASVTVACEGEKRNSSQSMKAAHQGCPLC